MSQQKQAVSVFISLDLDLMGHTLFFLTPEWFFEDPYSDKKNVWQMNL